MHWFYDPHSSANSEQIAESEVKHLASLRIRPGERIVVTDGLGSANVFELQDPKAGTLSFVEQIEVKPARVRIHLVQALAKGDRDELALQASVELGIASAAPWQAEHSVSNWRGKEDKSRERWRQIAISAMKQSQQAFLPAIEQLIATKDLKPRGVGILLLPEAPVALSDAQLTADEYTIVVGPEGGISQQEVAQLEASGFTPYRLGPSVLRTSSAGPAAIAAISALSGAWSVE